MSSSIRKAAWWSVAPAAAAAVLGAAAVLLFSLWMTESGWWRPASLLLLVGGAASLVGAFLGFLFGIPRTVIAAQSGADDGRAVVGMSYASLDRLYERDDASRNGLSERVGPNTNLEQVSDWLTKILLGASLTQLGQAPASLERLANALAPAVAAFAQAETRDDVRTSVTVFIGALVVAAAILGFIAGWLVARAWLPLLLRAVRT